MRDFKQKIALTILVEILIFAVVISGHLYSFVIEEEFPLKLYYELPLLTLAAVVFILYLFIPFAEWFLQKFQ